jgi:hypothetical protein
MAVPWEGSGLYLHAHSNVVLAGAHSATSLATPGV